MNHILSIFFASIFPFGPSGDLDTEYSPKGANGPSEYILMVKEKKHKDKVDDYQVFKDNVFKFYSTIVQEDKVYSTHLACYVIAARDYFHDTLNKKGRLSEYSVLLLDYLISIDAKVKVEDVMSLINYCGSHDTIIYCPTKK